MRLLTILPDEGREKHEIWFKAEELWVAEFIAVVDKWLRLPQNQCAESEINQDDRVSNVEIKKHSHVSSRNSSSGPSTSKTSVLRECIILEAERAALVARAECLKQKHDLEEQVERLRKQKEKMDIDAEIAASTAKLSVLKTFEQQT